MLNPRECTLRASVEMALTDSVRNAPQHLCTLVVDYKAPRSRKPANISSIHYVLTSNVPVVACYAAVT